MTQQHLRYARCELAEVLVDFEHVGDHAIPAVGSDVAEALGIRRLAVTTVVVGDDEIASCREPIADAPVSRGVFTHAVRDLHRGARRADGSPSIAPQ